MIQWAFVTSAQYFAEDATYDANTLYFISDTGEIYRGDKPFGEAVVMVDDTAAGSFDAALAAIAAPARRKLYISAKTLEGKIYNGTAWVQAIKPVDATVTADGVNPVSGKAVADYVAAEIAKINGGTAFVTNVAYDATKKALTVSNGDNDTEIVLDGLGVEIAYDKATGALTLKDVKGAVLGSAVNLDLERFVSAAAYDETNHQIILAFTGVTGIAGGTYTYPGTMPADPTEGLACKAGDKWYVYKNAAWAELAAADTPLSIDVADLVDTYTAGETSTIKLTVSNHEFTGAVKVSATAGNQLTAKDDGLYVAATDLSSCMKLVADAVENNIATFGANGQVKDSGKKVGAAALAATPDADTLATEAAVAAVRTALTTAIDAKAAKVTGATAGNLAGLTADGDLADSGKKVGAAALAATPDADTVATEKAVKDYVDTKTANMLETTDKKTTVSATDTDDTIPTSKAVATALTWKTTM